MTSRVAGSRRSSSGSAIIPPPHATATIHDREPRPALPRRRDGRRRRRPVLRRRAPRSARTSRRTARSIDVLREPSPAPGATPSSGSRTSRGGEPETDAHLRALAADGVRIYWIDHHRTGARACPRGLVDVPFTDSVLSRGVRRLAPRSTSTSPAAAAEGERLAALRRASRRSSPWPTTTTAGCTAFRARASSRWTVRALGPRRVSGLLGARRARHLHATDGARRASRRRRRDRTQLRGRGASRVERRIGDVTLVVAVCDGHPSEIADAWGKEMSGTRSSRSTTRKAWRSAFADRPIATVGLSTLAQALGGGGHAAAAGAEQLPDLHAPRSPALVADAVERRRSSSEASSESGGPRLEGGRGGDPSGPADRLRCRRSPTHRPAPGPPPPRLCVRPQSCGTHAPTSAASDPSRDAVTDVDRQLSSARE